MQLYPIRVAFIASACFLLACDATDPAVPGSIAIAAGDGQAGAAGVALAIEPAVRVLDERGRPLGGIAVSFAVVAGEGSVQNAHATTGSDGTARAGAWTLGARAGANALTASVAGLAPVTFAAAGTPGSPATLTIVEGDGQSAVVGARLPLVPAVRAVDAFGNPTPDVPVRFATEPGGGTIALSIATTDASGIARGGTWTLDTIAGTQGLRASLDGGASVRVAATALADTAVTFERAAAADQTGTVGEAAAESPAVIARDRYGNPVPGASIRFVVTAGDGRLHAAGAGGTGVDSLEVAADGAGRATVPRWTFGTRAGPQAVRATLRPGLILLFSALARPGPPTGLAIVRGQDQSAQAGTIVALAPTVSVADVYGNPIAGLPVSFIASAGGGIVNPGPAATAADGTAAPLSWILGLQPGPNSLVAASPGLPDVVFEATATPGEPFHFEYFFINADAQTEAALRSAAARWERALLAGQPDVEGTLAAGLCGPVAQSGPFDDLRLVLLVDSIDGPGQILAGAGPCAVRASTRMPAIGGIILDSADVRSLSDAGQLADVLVHEIGHILGIGTRWGGGLLVGSTGDDPHFVGTAARAAFRDAGGDAYAGVPVPVENTGGPGTRNGHWRESVFRNELMTGYINAGANPLSAVSIASLQDVGYFVDAFAADVWAVGAPLGAQSPGEPPGIRLLERPWPGEPVPLGPAPRR